MFLTSKIQNRRRYTKKKKKKKKKIGIFNIARVTSTHRTHWLWHLTLSPGKL